MVTPPASAVGIQMRRATGSPAAHASQAATNPTMPAPTSPHPATAVNVEADSIVCRMKARVSCASWCSGDPFMLSPSGVARCKELYTAK